MQAPGRIFAQSETPRRGTEPIEEKLQRFIANGRGQRGLPGLRPFLRFEREARQRHVFMVARLGAQAFA